MSPRRSMTTEPRPAPSKDDPARTARLDTLVSIVLPVYNGERWISGALDSALGQTHRAVEVIVVDDGSHDRTLPLVEARARADSRVRVLSQANRGLAATRNRAIEVARGEFIAPLDADDLWDPTKIERQLRRMVDAGSQTGLVYCWWVWMDTEGAILDSSPRWRIEGDGADALLQVNFVGNSSVPFFRRAVLEEVGGYDVMLTEGCEDWDLALRVAERSRVAVAPAPLVGYRWHRGNMSGRTDAMWRSHGRVMERARNRRTTVRPALVRRSRAQFALYLAGVSFWSGAYARALGWGLRALRSSVALSVLPSVIRLLSTALIVGRSRGRTIRPGVAFADWSIPPTPIPYDVIYDRRFKRWGLGMKNQRLRSLDG